MFNVNFNLRNPKAKKKTPINAVIRYNNKKLVFPTDEKILPKQWLFKDQLAIQSTKFPEYSDLNGRLLSIKSDINKVFTNYQNQNDNKIPSTDELRELLRIKFKKNTDTGKTNDFIQYYENYLKRLPNEINTKTKEKLNPATIRARANVLNILKKFKKRIPFEKINKDFYTDLTEYIGKHNYSVNYQGKIISIIKTVLHAAQEDYETVFISKKFMAPAELTPAIYLTVEELELLEKLDLSENRKLNNVRDAFLLGCWTGLRYSDLKLLTPDKIQNDIICITTQKTKNSIVIPVLPPARRILNKYIYIVNGKQYLPRVYSNQKMNDYLKDLGKLVEELNENIPIEIRKNGMKVNVKRPKYELIKTHTMRRTFATNRYLDNAPIISIMEVTGHKTEKEFMKYIRMTKREHAKELQDNYYKTHNLKVV